MYFTNAWSVACMCVCLLRKKTRGERGIMSQWMRSGTIFPNQRGSYCRGFTSLSANESSSGRQRSRGQFFSFSVLPYVVGLQKFRHQHTKCIVCCSAMKQICWQKVHPADLCVLSSPNRGRGAIIRGCRASPLWMRSENAHIDVQCGSSSFDLGL